MGHSRVCIFVSLDINVCDLHSALNGIHMHYGSNLEPTLQGRDFLLLPNLVVIKHQEQSG